MTEVRCVRVVKLGGSLLELPGLPAVLRSWFARQPPAVSLLLVGGGRFVAALREADRVHRLDAEACHWLAVRAMGWTARLVQSLVGSDWPLVDRLADFYPRALSKRGTALAPVCAVVLFDPLVDLQADADAHATAMTHVDAPAGASAASPRTAGRDDVAPEDAALPADWRVTSDSIAAWLAERLQADELVLLKSRLPQASDLSAAVREGYVDPYFPTAARGRTVRCVNLREPELPEALLRGEPLA